jgi:hypothetical protein
MSAARRLSRLGFAVALASLLGCMYSPSSDTRTGSGNEVAAPVFSSDPCNTDDDCAPVAECHPIECVQLAHVGTMPPGTVCTTYCAPGTTDCGFNHCGCAADASGARLCALLPGPKPP